MQQVLSFIDANDFASALVRIWVIAGEREGNETRLILWERTRDPSQFENQKATFLRRFATGEKFTSDAVRGAELAFACALDEYQFQTSTSQPYFESAFTCGKRSYWLVPVASKARRERSGFRAQAGNPESWFRFHAFIPATTTQGIRVKCTPATGSAAEVLEEQANRNEIVAWVAHFPDQAASSGNVRLVPERSAAGRLWFTGVAPPEPRQDSINEQCRLAIEQQAHIMVLPELTVPLSMREALRSRLRGSLPRFALVVPGSFHEEIDGQRHNRAELWDGKGETLISHRKLRLYGQAEGLAEDIADGDLLEIFLSAIGSLALPICKDFCDAHAKVATLFQEVPVDLILVPSYGAETTIDAHKRRAHDLARLGPGTTTVIAGQRNVEAGDGPACPGFVHIAGEADPVDISTGGGHVPIPLGLQGPPKPPRKGRNIRLVK